MRDFAKGFYRYLPISEREELWGLYVKAGGFQTFGPGWQPRPEHPRGYEFSWSKGRIFHEYSVIYVVRGEGTFESRVSGAKKVSAGNAILLFPGVWHRYRPAADVGWDAYWINFSGHDVERLAKHGFISPQNPVLNTGLDDLILRAFLTLLDRLRSEPVGLEQLLAATAMEIMAATLGAVRARQAGSQMHELVCRAKTLLEMQDAPMLAMEKLAASLGLSTTRFYRIFHEHTGLSPYQYYLQLRIERAKQMLHGTTMTVKEIATALAFESPFHFSKAFKRKAGMAPSQWRKQV